MIEITLGNGQKVNVSSLSTPIEFTLFVPALPVVAPRNATFSNETITCGEDSELVPNEPVLQNTTVESGLKCSW